MDMITIDGSLGEGGGQILRTTLTLSMLYQVDVRIINIRAKRHKPGLLRQHLTCVRAAKTICHADVEGDVLGSSEVTFKPKAVQHGEYHFAVGTAGSTALVCQTILLPLAFAEGESHIVFEGGTHNGSAPSVTFLDDAFFPVLESMGLVTQRKLTRYGFYPAGGGEWSLTVFPIASLNHLDGLVPHPIEPRLADNVFVRVFVSRLPETVAEAEHASVINTLGVEALSTKTLKVPSVGPGNLLSIRYPHTTHQSLFEQVGTSDIRAEKVAKQASNALLAFIQSGAAVETHLADQLLLPLLIGKGKYTTTRPSLHTTTNIAVIEQITGVRITCTQEQKHRWLIACE